MRHEKLMVFLNKIQACPSARRWVRRDKRNALRAWRECTHPGWLLFALDWLPNLDQDTWDRARRAARHAGLSDYEGVNTAVCKAIRSAVPFKEVLAAAKAALAR